MSADTNAYRQILSDETVIGDHNSIMFLGCEAQEKMRRISCSMSEILLNDDSDIEYLIENILEKINASGDDLNFSGGLLSVFKSQTKKKEQMQHRYRELFKYIDKMTIALQLQEAQLLKNTAIFEQMKTQIEETAEELQIAINSGEAILKQAEQMKRELTDDRELNLWIERLDKRISNLRITHTVSLQSKAQLQMMWENNVKLTDKIISALSETLPIWRNQIALLLGMEQLSAHAAVQEKVSRVIKDNIKDSAQEIRCKTGKEAFSESDYKKLNDANTKLKQILNELFMIEQQDAALKVEMNSLMLKSVS